MQNKRKTGATGAPVQDPEILKQAENFAKRLNTRPNDQLKPEFPLKPLAWSKKYTAKFRNVLTPQECQALIQLSETAGYEQALVSVGPAQQVLMPK